MNKRLLRSFALISSSAFLGAGCGGDNSSFEAQDTSIATNSGTVSQINFTLAASDPFPAVYDASTGFTETTVEIVAKVGDLNNQLLTDEHTIFFKTEWGLINPSCTTVNGKCSVTWQTSKFDNIPFDLLNTVTAWTVGEEGFTDTNGNGIFDDADTTFDDIVEPFVNADLSTSVFDAAEGDVLIDVVNGNDLTGVNGEHDFGDGFLNSPNCTHSSLCSTVAKTTFIWDDTQLDMSGPP